MKTTRTLLGLLLLAGLLFLAIYGPLIAASLHNHH